MKKISVLIPCYNEQENVEAISKAVLETLTRDLPQYDYELVFIDNDSTDETRPILRRLCAENLKIKAIFNARNFGQFNSPYYGMLQVTGDCVIEMVADFQDPVDMIPKYVKAWEEGYKIVIGIKTSSKENKIMYALRSFYYKTIKRLSDVEQIEHFTGSGLYDRDFIEVLRNLDDPTPFLRGIVAELGYKRKEIPYEQPKTPGRKDPQQFLPSVRCGHAQCDLLYEGRSAPGNLCGGHQRLLKHGGSHRLPGHEADLVGPFSGRHGADAHRNAVSGIGADLFYRYGGRVCPFHQPACDAPSACCGRRTSELRGEIIS